MDKTLQEMIASFQRKTSEIAEAQSDVKEILDTLNTFFINQQQDYEKINQMIKKLNIGDSDIVKFNVGGKIFSTYISTLTRKIKKHNSDEFYEPHLLQGLVSGVTDVNLDEYKAIFIDRNPKYFSYVLDFLRVISTEEFNFDLPKNEDVLRKLIKEAEFYRLDSFKDLLLESLQLQPSLIPNTPTPSNTNVINFDSLILTPDLSKDLIKLCKFTNNQKWKLIYRGSQNGFKSKDFHSKCDGLTKTLTIIKTINSFIFGGYTEAAWSQKGTYETDSNAFIFSLMNKDKKPIVLYCSESQYAISGNSSFGPTFGGGLDIYIADKSNTNMSNYSNLGFTYKHPQYAYGSNEAKCFLAGAYNFQTAEIEVFQKEC